MKILPKLIAVSFTASAMFFTTSLKAQTTGKNQFNLGLGAEVGVPTGVSRLGANFTLGATGRLQYGLSDKFALMLTTGGYHFFPKMIPGTDKRYGSYGEIPVKIGVKEFFVPNIYVAAEGGLAWEKLEQGWAPFHRRDLSGGVGYATKRWDIGVRYEDFYMKDYHSGLIGLRLAYGIGL
jgi:hypothetical protein